MADAGVAIRYRKDRRNFFFMVRKHDNLMRWVVGGQGFVSAYHSVLRNKGAAGVDGVKTEDHPLRDACRENAPGKQLIGSVELLLDKYKNNCSQKRESPG